MKKEVRSSSRSEYRQKLYKLSLAALFISLSIILTRYASITPLPSIRIGFGSLPIQVAGIFLGPITGGLVGLIADPLGFVMNPQGTYHLGFTLSSVLNAVIPGLLAMTVRQRSKSTKAATFYLASLTTISITVICSALLNTLWLAQILHTSYEVLFISRLPATLLTGVVHFALLIIVIPALERAGASRIMRSSRYTQV